MVDGKKVFSINHKLITNYQKLLERSFFMPKTRQQKEDLVKIFADKIRDSKSVVFTDYKGLTMAQMSDLRNKLRTNDAEFTVTKNALLDIALKNDGFESLPDDLQAGPTATLFSFGDEVAGIKDLVKALKDAGKGEIKGGYLNGQFLDKYSVTRLASLPTKLELQGKVVGLLNAPLVGMVNVLQGNLRNLVYALDQIRISKGGES